MEIKIYGTLRLALGQKTVRVDLPAGAALDDYLLELIRLYPALRAELLDSRGGLRQDLPLFINGRNPRLLPQNHRPILDLADDLCLFSPVSSGRLNVEALRQPSAGNKESPP